MAPLKEFAKKSVQNHHLATRIEKFFTQDRVSGVGVHRPVEQERVRADLAKLHYGVLQFHVVNLLHYHRVSINA